MESGGEVMGMIKSTLVVTQSSWREWRVTREGDRHGLPLDDRLLAIEYARAMAEALAPARVLVRDRRGKVEAEWRYDCDDDVRAAA